MSVMFMTRILTQKTSMPYRSDVQGKDCGGRVRVRVVFLRNNLYQYLLANNLVYMLLFELFALHKNGYLPKNHDYSSFYCQFFIFFPPVTFKKEFRKDHPTFYTLTPNKQNFLHDPSPV